MSCKVGWQIYRDEVQSEKKKTSWREWREGMK